MGLLLASCNMLRVFSLLIFVLYALGLSAQELVFSRVTAEDGLSPGGVLAIAQDEKGFMWYGTQNGLNRYDARRFKTYKHTSAGKLNNGNNDYITCLLHDSYKNLWVGTRNGLSKYDPQKDHLQEVKIHPLSTNNNLKISCIYEDRQKRIWVWTSSGLYVLSDRAKNAFNAIKLPIRLTSAENDSKGTVYQDSKGFFWLGTPLGLIKVTYGKEKTSYQYYQHDSDNEHSISDNYVTSITEDLEHHLWVGTQQGLNLLYPDSHTFKRYKSTNTAGLLNDNVRVLKTDRTGKLWIGTQGGLSIYDSRKKTFKFYQSTTHNNEGLSNNSIHSIFQDKHGNVWVGTYWGGVNLVSKDDTPFYTYQTQSSAKVNNDVIGAVLEDSFQNLWIGTEGNGIAYINKKTNKIIYFKNNVKNRKSLSSDLVKVIYEDLDHNIWIGTHGGGLNLFNSSNQSFTRFLNQSNNPAMRDSEVLTLLDTEEGLFWVGMQTGLVIFKRSGRSLEQIGPNLICKIVDKRTVRTIVKAKNGDIWLGTADGIFRLQKKSGKIEHFTVGNGLPKNNVNCIYEDRKENIWFGFQSGGFAMYNPSNRHKLFKTFNVAKGLADENVNAILDDEQGNLWISTGNGLSKFNLRDNSFRNYNKEDGLAGNIFNVNSCYKSPTQLYFGGYNGLTSFRPSSVKDNLFAPPTFLTGLKVFNSHIGIEPKGLIEKEISLVKELQFSHSQNLFTIEFAALNYNQPKKNTYAYKLDGFDKAWNYSQNPAATYMNLPSGEYVLWLKGTNNDGVWGNATAVAITVLPPYWKTVWAYALYAIAIASISFFVIRFFVLRSLIKRDRELNQFKLDFFTNISHEMRTHLSLINGPAEKLLVGSTEDNGNTKHLKIIKRNSESLLQLVTEIMDFRKIEIGNFWLNVSKNDIVKFIQEIFDSFYDVALTLNINSRFSASSPNLELFFDQSQLKKVFFNLISNAYKFTPHGGKILVSIEEKKNDVVVKIRDNGKGISPESINNLFTNYFQEDDSAGENKGYGIGLALAKSIVELHKGNISVESIRANNEIATTFTVTLRKGHRHFSHHQNIKLFPGSIQYEKIEQRVEPPKLSVELNKTKIGSYTVLLIEDNQEIISFIRSILESTYNIVESENGVSGWEKAIDIIPDLIISDIMMPGLDGRTLCSRLKADDRTSHIPVILLTALCAENHQISSLENGADIYLTKPFSTQVLNLHISNLLRLGEKIRTFTKEQFIVQKTTPEHFTGATLNEATLESKVDAFLTKAINIVESNIDNTDFSVGDFANNLAMSKPVLYKKIQAVSGLSVNDFIKSVRLNKARFLLLENLNNNVSEVAYMVGFSDPKYFSKEFKKKFGRSPKDWRSYGSNNLKEQ